MTAEAWEEKIDRKKKSYDKKQSKIAKTNRRMSKKVSKQGKDYFAIWTLFKAQVASDIVDYEKLVPTGKREAGKYAKGIKTLQKLHQRLEALWEPIQAAMEVRKKLM